MCNRSDSKLVADYLKGDEASLEVLIQQYLKQIYGFAYRYVGNQQDAEDVTQEAFIKSWRHLKRFDQSKSFKTWIFAIAKNTSIDFLKKKKAIPFSQFEDEEGNNMFAEKIVDPSPLPQEVFEKTSIAKGLALIINKLSPRYRAVVLLRYNDQLAFREIAESLQESIHTVKSRYRRALILLRKSLES